MELEQFKDLHKGETAAVLGGGPSLPRDLWKIPKGAKLVGINQHTLILPLDYCFFSDPRVWYVVQQYEVNVITNYAVIRDRRDVMFAATVPNVGLSGPMAIWCCEFLGFDSIHVCGIDGYQADRRYWHSLERHDVQGQSMEPWTTVRDKMRRPERVSFADARMNAIWHEKSN
jgi:hypothetical protein